eukprot:327199-Hanusia_phi.AAC.4
MMLVPRGKKGGGPLLSEGAAARRVSVTPSTCDSDSRAEPPRGYWHAARAFRLGPASLSGPVGR